MNLIQIFRRFPDPEACIAHLEQIRWERKNHAVPIATTDMSHAKRTAVTWAAGTAMPVSMFSWLDFVQNQAV